MLSGNKKYFANHCVSISWFRQIFCPMKVFVVCLMALFAVAAANNVSAGLIRDKDKFNRKADGYYMKGRCFKPGGAAILEDAFGFLFGKGWKDVGCVVKNRRGKRRPKKKPADVYIHLSLYGRNELGLPEILMTERKVCENVRKCRFGFSESRKTITGGSIEVNIPSGKPSGGGIETMVSQGALDRIGGEAAVEGLRACIIGQRGDSKIYTIHSNVGFVGDYRQWKSKSGCPDEGFSTGSSVQRLISSSACADSVQGKIAWNYQGSKNWAPSNISKLCEGVDTSAPAKCFDRVMHGGVNWGSGTKWRWQNALDLCEGTRHSRQPIECFEDVIKIGYGWQSAVAVCDSQ